jgi:divalent metal cation (Fe/Co/Zn/Cd) transporter
MSRAVNADAWHHRIDAITPGPAFIGISICPAGWTWMRNGDDPEDALFSFG